MLNELKRLSKQNQIINELKKNISRDSNYEETNSETEENNN